MGTYGTDIPKIVEKKFDIKIIFIMKRITNPFIIENKRSSLAEKKQLNKLKKMYAKTYPEIKDLNTPHFWDQQMEIIEHIKVQDGMTQDRIATAAKYLPENAIKILDIGAGHGYLEEVLSQNKNLEIYANDFSVEGVKNLKKRFKGKFAVQSIYKLSYPKNYFDCIFVLEVLEHIPPSKIFSVLKSIKNILKKNGILVVSVPMNEGLEHMKTNPNGHVRTYTEVLIKAELEIAGFHIIESQTFFAFTAFYSLKKFLAKIFPKRWEPNNIIVKAKLYEK